MKIKRLYFIPGGIAQFWKGEEERRSRLEAHPGDKDHPAVDMELLPNMGGLVRLMYGGSGPYILGPNVISGMVPFEDTPHKAEAKNPKAAVPHAPHPKEQ